MNISGRNFAVIFAKSRLILSLQRRLFASEFKFDDWGFYPQPLDHLNRRQVFYMRSRLLGDERYEPKIMFRDKGSDIPEYPNLIPSYASRRLVVCTCSPEDDVEDGSWHYMWVEKDKLTQCPCGYYYSLCDPEWDFKCM